MKYRGEMIHIKLDGNIYSTNLYLGINSTKRVGNALRELCKQIDPNKFSAWVTSGYTNKKHKIRTISRPE